MAPQHFLLSNLTYFSAVPRETLSQTPRINSQFSEVRFSFVAAAIWKKWKVSSFPWHSFVSFLKFYISCKKENGKFFSSSFISERNNTKYMWVSFLTDRFFKWVSFCKHAGIKKKNKRTKVGCFFEFQLKRDEKNRTGVLFSFIL